MVSTGARFAASITSNATGTAWTNPTNLGADDAADASVTLGAFGASRTLTLTQFDFSDVPDDATLTGVRAYWQGTDSTSGSASNALKQVVGGSVTARVQSFTLSSLGSTADSATWSGGSDPTVAQVKASNFGLTLRCSDVDGDGLTETLDYVALGIEYTPFSAGGGSLTTTSTVASNLIGGRLAG